jgi:hypothetical protein
MKEVAEEVGMWFYPQEGFAEMNKDANIENRIGVQVMKVKAIIEKKTIEEIRTWESRSTLDKILE